MFGYKIISERELRKLKTDLACAEIKAENHKRQAANESRWNHRLEEENSHLRKMITTLQNTIKAYTEALEEQTREKKAIEQNFNDYIAAEILMR